MEATEILELNRKFKTSTAEQILAYFIEQYKGEIALATSLSLEDQILTKMICDIDKGVEIFTLDTGRLFPESYSLLESTTTFFDKKIVTYFPDYKEVENMVYSNSINLFYSSVESRRECCRVRKLTPLKRAFKGLKVWVCGLRQEQSITRYGLNPIEWDEQNGLLKIAPLYNWSQQQVTSYVKEHELPYNPLFDKGFLSIGCQPCTRAVAEGEDERSGRWWWENPDTKECGLHKSHSKIGL